MKFAKFFTVCAIVAAACVLSLSSCKKDTCYTCAGASICEDDWDNNALNTTGLSLAEYVDALNALQPGTCTED